MPEALRTFLDLQSQVVVTGTLKAHTAFRIGAGRDTRAHTPDLPIVVDLPQGPAVHPRLIA